MSAALIFVVALAVRALVAASIAFPTPEDTAYYFGVARNLVGGRGLVSDALWSYQTPPLIFPRPAFEVWLPLPTLLAAMPMAVLGTTFSVAQLPSILIGAVVPVLSWRLAADVAAERGLPIGRARVFAIGVGLTSAVYLPLILHSALPDSTMPFAFLALGACLLMSRIARDPRGLRRGDFRVVGLGALIGLAALTRNEALWLGLAWAIVAWGIPGVGKLARGRAVAIAGLVAFAIFAPWMLRDWLAFGSPLPGQAASNALSVTGFDIFAWNDPPTVGRYLAVGPARLLAMRAEGIWHNLFSVLLVPGLPLSAIGLVALRWQARGAALRPVVLVSAITFLVTSLVFPVATTWGTFLHAAGPAHVLLIIAALLGLDAALARAGVYRGWTRPVAWLGPTLGVSGSILFSVIFLPAYGGMARETEAQFLEVARRMAAVGVPLDQRAGPVISNFPIWLAETAHIPVLALPNEPPSDVLDLARTFDARLLVLVHAEAGKWPAILSTGVPGAECFQPLDLGPGPLGSVDPLADVDVYRIACP